MATILPYMEQSNIVRRGGTTPSVLIKFDGIDGEFRDVRFPSLPSLSIVGTVKW